MYLMGFGKLADRQPTLSTRERLLFCGVEAQLPLLQ